MSVFVQNSFLSNWLLQYHNSEGTTSNGMELSRPRSYKPTYVLTALVIFACMLIGIIIPLIVVFLAGNENSSNVKLQKETTKVTTVTNIITSTGNV